MSFPKGLAGEGWGKNSSGDILLLWRDFNGTTSPRFASVLPRTQQSTQFQDCRSAVESNYVLRSRLALQR